jgi:hypothetical protein
MKGRHLESRTRRRRVGAATLLMLSLSALPVAAHAGIFRDLLSDVGLAKDPQPPKPGTAAAQTLPRQGFACCVLHYKKDTIEDSNYASLPLIPAGTPIEVINYGRHRAYIKIESKNMVLMQEESHDQEPLESWVGKMVVSADPRPHISAYPKPVQEAIRIGKVMVGMTREQAIAAVGYPLANENVTLDSPIWRVWRAHGEEYDLNFGSDGRLKSVTGDEGVTSQVIYQPGR